MPNSLGLSCWHGSSPAHPLAVCIFTAYRRSASPLIPTQRGSFSERSFKPGLLGLDGMRTHSWHDLWGLSIRHLSGTCIKWVVPSVPGGSTSDRRPDLKICPWCVSRARHHLLDLIWPRRVQDTSTLCDFLCKVLNQKAILWLLAPQSHTTASMSGLLESDHARRRLQTIPVSLPRSVNLPFSSLCLTQKEAFFRARCLREWIDSADGVSILPKRPSRPTLTAGCGTCA